MDSQAGLSLPLLTQACPATPAMGLWGVTSSWEHLPLQALASQLSAGTLVQLHASPSPQHPCSPPSWLWG